MKPNITLLVFLLLSPVFLFSQSSDQKTLLKLLEKYNSYYYRAANSHQGGDSTDIHVSKQIFADTGCMFTYSYEKRTYKNNSSHMSSYKKEAIRFNWKDISSFTYYSEAGTLAIISVLKDGEYKIAESMEDVISGKIYPYKNYMNSVVFIKSRIEDINGISKKDIYTLVDLMRKRVKECGGNATAVEKQFFDSEIEIPIR